MKFEKFDGFNCRHFVIFLLIIISLQITYLICKIDKAIEKHNETIKTIKNINTKQKQASKSNSIGRKDRGFVFRPKTELEDNKFKVNVKLPKNFDINDIKVVFENNILTIRAEKQYSIDEKEKQAYSYSSFFKTYEVPETKATINDVNIELDKEDGNELQILIPII